MTLTANSTMTFTAFTPLDDGIIQINLVCLTPGAGEATDYIVYITDAEFAAASTNPLLRTLVSDKLNRKYRLTGFTRLTALLGATFSV